MNKFVTAEDEKKDFLCPTNNGNFADPSTCRRFYQVSINVLLFPYTITQIQRHNEIVSFRFRLGKRISLFVICFVLLKRLCKFPDSNFFLSFSLPMLFQFQCVDGYPYVNRCPSGLYFDDISKYCTFKNEARCGPVPLSKLFFCIFT